MIPGKIISLYISLPVKRFLTDLQTTSCRLIEENKDQTLSNENSFRSLPSNDDLEGYNQDVRVLLG